MLSLQLQARGVLDRDLLNGRAHTPPVAMNFKQYRRARLRFDEGDEMDARTLQCLR